MRYIKLVSVLVLVALAGVGCYFLFKPSQERAYKTEPGHINYIRDMVKLCALDFYEEVPFKDSINGKWIVATEKIQGTVKFDLEKLNIRCQGDTLTVVLPPEKVEIFESTEPGAYRIIDSWDSRHSVFGRQLTDTEENVLKERLRDRLERNVNERGYVRRARANAVATLAPLFSLMSRPGSVITVIDTVR